MEIVPGIYMVDGSIGCNTYLLVDDGVTLVDTGLRGNVPKIYASLGRIGLNPRAIKRIVVTHAHLDHINCLHQLKEDTGAIVMANALDSDIIEGRKPLRVGHGAFTTLSGVINLYARYKPVTVDVRLKDDDPITGAFDARAVYLPGHSAGNTGLYSREKKTFFSSDSLRVSGGRMVTPSPRFTADMEAAITSVRRMGEFDFDVLLPGHGTAVTDSAATKVRELYREIGR
ncbi:MAG TPA: MBL fold metallo-hydrolase [Methanocella sp.]|jgi:glyoxylase-like metal-dependent hydrolase (beta-lactamase superfamily II)